MGKVKLGEYIERVSIRANELDDYSQLEALGVSNVNGITTTSHTKSADLAKYLYIEENYFAYNPYRINVGSIGLTPKCIKGLVSPAYIVFKTKDTLKPELLFDFLKSFDGLQQINKLAKGTVRKTLSFENLSKIELIVPSPQKQENILKLKQNTEYIKNRLLDEISAQQTLLKKLRQSILQEAIEGKLTASWREQNSDVESASVLLEKIRQEKEQLVKEKKIKKQKPLLLINEDEIPFDIPDSWEWCRLGTILDSLVGGNSYHSSLFKEDGINQVLRLGNIRPYKLRL
ncbi:MAG: restriction endonuclease subunit S, partial [Sulfurovum sp.]|nr:restriction endonuclease subunit S [Sulfurovum sp.]